MTNEMRILLVSPDLLSTSRIAALARPLPARVETLRSLDDEPREGPFDLILLDLQALAGDAAVIVARAVKLVEQQVAGAGRAPKLVAFGPHVQKERLADAVAAGADEAVSRGELLGSFPGLVKRWVG
jgi:CheY-like chemotaxis protein